MKALPHLTVSTLLAFLTLGVCSCTVLTYTGPTGERFTRSSFGANTSFASLAVAADTNGVRRIELRGYKNSNTEALGTVTEAAVRAAIQSVK